MNLTKLAETVLLQVEAFWVLQEMEQKWIEHEPNVVRFLTELYTLRKADYSQIHPLLRLMTGISTLFVPIAFTLQSDSLELKVIQNGLDSGKYEVGLTGLKSEAHAMLSIFRNATAHMPDFISPPTTPNISFDEGILCCRSYK